MGVDFGSPSSNVGGMSPDGETRFHMGLHSSRQLCLFVRGDQSLPMQSGLVVLFCPFACSSYWVSRTCSNVLSSHETAGFIRLQLNPKTLSQVPNFPPFVPGNNWTVTSFTFVNNGSLSISTTTNLHVNTDKEIRHLFQPFHDIAAVIWSWKCLSVYFGNTTWAVRVRLMLMR